MTFNVLPNNEIPDDVLPIKWLKKGFPCIPLAASDKVLQIRGFEPQSSVKGYKAELYRLAGESSRGLSVRSDRAAVVCQGILGIDIDVKDGKEGDKEFARFKQEWNFPDSNFVVSTKSGGKHYYYKVPEDAKISSQVSFTDSKGSTFTGIDLRNGSSLLFCSTGLDDRYKIYNDDIDSIADLTELSQELVDIFPKKTERDETEPAERQSTIDSATTLFTEVPKEAVQGGRNNALHKEVSKMIGRGYTYDELRSYAFYCNSTYKPPMDDEEVMTTLDSAWNAFSGQAKETALRRVRERFLLYPTSNKVYIIDLVASMTTAVHMLLPVLIQTVGHMYQISYQDLYGKEPTTSTDKKPQSLIAYAVEHGLLRTVRMMGYRPGQPRYVSIDEYSDRHNGQEVAYMFNTYIDPALPDLKGATVEQSMAFCADWFKVAKHLCSNNDRDLDLFLDWLAFLVQKPAERISFAPYFVSYQGSGRGTIGSFIRHLVGDTNNSQITHSALISNFNADTSKKKLIWIDELPEFMTPQDVNKFTSNLNTMITEPTVRCELKGIDAVHIENYACVMISTNFETSIRITSGTRRIMPFIQLNRADGRPDDEVYARLNGLIANMNKNDKDSVQRVKEYTAHLDNILRHRDISHFNSKSFAPKTSSTSKLIEDNNTTLFTLLETDIAQRRGVFKSDITSVEAILGHCALFYPDKKWSEVAIKRLVSDADGDLTEGTLFVKLSRGNGRIRNIVHPRVAPISKDNPIIMLEDSLQMTKRVPVLYCVRDFDYWSSAKPAPADILQEYIKISGTSRTVGAVESELKNLVKNNVDQINELDNDN